MSGKTLAEDLEYIYPCYFWLNGWNSSSAEDVRETSRSSRPHLCFKSWFHCIGNGGITSSSMRILISLI